MNDTQSSDWNLRNADNAAPRRRRRLTIATVMLSIIPLALLFVAARNLWFRPVPKFDVNPLMGSRMDATQLADDIDSDQVTIAVRYNLRLTTSRSPKGTNYLAWCEVWLQDQESNTPSVSHTFIAPLTVGGREAASGSFTWKPDGVLPGTYRVYTRVRFHDPFRGWIEQSGSGGSDFQVRDAP